MSYVYQILDDGNTQRVWDITCDAYAFFDARRNMEVIPALAEYDATGELLVSHCAMTLKLGEEYLTNEEVDVLIDYIIRDPDPVLEFVVAYVKYLTTNQIAVIFAHSSEPAAVINYITDLRDKIQEKLGG